MDIRENKGRYCKYDFSDDDNVWIEVTHEQEMQYPTTLLTCNKVTDTENKKGIVFLFKFTDELCYIKYDKYSLTLLNESPSCCLL